MPLILVHSFSLTKQQLTMAGPDLGNGVLAPQLPRDRHAKSAGREG
ncbi:MAG: hypothetical protein ACRD2O_00700 [Terriglobia bacterium]